VAQSLDGSPSAADTAHASDLMLIDRIRRLFAGRKSEGDLAEARRCLEAGDLERAEALCAGMPENLPADRAADVHFPRGAIALRAKRPAAAPASYPMRRRDFSSAGLRTRTQGW